MDTNKEFEAIMAECRDLFAKKLHDYGASWRILRPSSLTFDSFFISRLLMLLALMKSWSVSDDGLSIRHDAP